MASPENELWMGILHRHMLSLWAREEEDDAAAAANAGWVRRSVIDLKPVLPWPIGKPKGKERACLAVVDEDPDVIFVGTEEDDGVFAVELESLARCASGKYARLANQEAVCFPS
ncbi:Os03g0609100 [Oryza sativa Japonica Group]|nr:Os03g0609100 [Oryza sativa Japonica Group]